MDFDAARLLDGLSGRERDGRRALLQRLAAMGFSQDELAAAVREDRLALLPVDRLLGGRFTAAEIEAEHGLPAALLTRARRLLGLAEPGPGDRVFGEEDVVAACATRRFLEAGLSEPSLAEISRVLGESMAR